MYILNKFNEKLDVLVEGRKYAGITIIFVHGIGTDKHETAGYFDDIAAALNIKFRTVRFDFSGYGISEGKQEESDFNKQAQDLKSVLASVRKKYNGKIYILAQSMGTFVTSLLNPDGITKTVFTSIPNSNTEYISNRLVTRFSERKGSNIDFNKISLIPRSTGKIQKLGPAFWTILRNFNPIKAITNYANKTELIVFHPLSDEICDNEFMDEYKAIPKLKFVELHGDHGFTTQKDRQNLIRQILNFFNSR